MTSRETYRHLIERPGLALCGGLVLAGWVTAVVALSVRTVDETSGRLAALGGGTATLAEVHGAAGPRLGADSTPEPRFTMLRLDPEAHRAVYAGEATRFSDVVLLQNGEVIAETQSDTHGRWVIVRAGPIDAGAHKFEVEARQPGQSRVVLGEAVRVLLPQGYAGRLDITYPGFLPSVQLAAVYADQDDIGAATPRRLNVLAQANEPDRRLRLAQRSGTSGADRDVEESAAASDPLRPAWQWLEDASRSYQSEIVHRLRLGGGFDVGRSNVDIRNEERPAQALPAGREDAAGRPTRWAEGISGWMEAARESYRREIVPRLTDDRVRAVPLPEDPRETRREEQPPVAKEEPDLSEAAQRADRERREAERQRRLSQERREAAEAEARELAERRRAAQEEERLRREQAREEAAEREARARERENEQRQQEDEAARQRAAAEQRANAEAERRLAEQRELEESERRRAEELRQAELRRQEEERERLIAARRRAEETERDRLARLEEDAERKRAAEARRRAEAEERRRAEEVERRRRREEAELNRREAEAREARDQEVPPLPRASQPSDRPRLALRVSPVLPSYCQIWCPSALHAAA